MSEQDSRALSSNQPGVGGHRVFTIQTARKRSKSSLALNTEQREPSSSESGHPNSSNYSWTTSQPLPASSFLQPDSSRPPKIMPPSISRSNSNSRLREPLRLGWVRLEYLADWLVVVIAIIALAASERTRPREGYIPKHVLADTNYPLLDNSVPPWSIPLYSLLAPAICIALHGAVLRRPKLEAHHLILGLATAVLVTGAVTNIIKAPVGRLRPDFNARCWPDGVIKWDKEDSYGGYAKCTGDSFNVEEGRKSFPSGHSSWSAAGLCYCTWILLDRLQVFGSGSGHPWRLLLACMPSLGALAVGISRYHDAWHYPTDIAAGLFLGGFISWLCYRQQRVRLAMEVDAVCYGGPVGQAGSMETTSRALMDITGLEDDGTPLLQQGALPV